MAKKRNQSDIMGLGVDIIEINRIEKAVERHKNFLARIFTENEIEYFNKKNMRAETIAGYFAAKEAIGKAMGTGIYEGNWKNIEIIKDDFGKPSAIFYGSTKEYIESKGFNDIIISISHCKTYAVANAVIL